MDLSKFDCSICQDLLLDPIVGESSSGAGSALKFSDVVFVTVLTRPSLILSSTCASCMRARCMSGAHASSTRSSLVSQASDVHFIMMRNLDLYAFQIDPPGLR